MATTVQFKRANTQNTNAITGANGEITIDTDKHVVVVHDGVTTGGWPLVRQDSPTISGIVTIAGNSYISNTIFIGNNTVNAVINSTSLNIGTNVSVNTSVLKVNSSLINSSSLYVTSNVSIGNSTTNTTVNSTSIFTGNSTVNATLTSSSLTIGSYYVNATTIVSQTQIANTSLQVGSSTANVFIDSSSITLSNSTVSTTISLPNTAQYSGQYALLANGSWYALSALSTSAAGASSQIQYNLGGAFGADSDFTYNSTTNTLTIGNTVVNNGIYASNGTTNTGISLPTSVEWATTNKFLHANGSWVTVTPAGSNTSIQYSNAGIISGNASFTYDYSTSTLGVGSNVSLNTSSLKIGNATVNTTINSSSINVNSIKVNSNTGLTIGSSITASNGFVWLPSGLMMQWGKVSANSTGGNITFANVFPNALYSIQFTVNTATWNSTYTPQLIASNTSTANVRTGNATTTTVFYTAIGS